MRHYVGRCPGSTLLSAARPSTLECLDHGVDQPLILENLVDPAQDRTPELLSVR
jgi:hypothetical protein